MAGMALCALLFSLPFILSVALDAGFLGLANEPLAYRFFYSERIFAGETVIVGVGYLISVLHHAVYAILHAFPAIASASLERRLDLFALVTNGILSAALCVLFFIAVRSTKLMKVDLVLLALLALTPIYAPGISGFDYALMADYHFLNIVLFVAGLLLFQLSWRNDGKVPGRAAVVLLGAFVGMAAANKITMLIVAGLVLIPVLIVRGAGWLDVLWRSLLAAFGLSGAFFAVHLASYLGNFQAMRAAMRIWMEFVLNPGSEPTFWNNLVGFAQNYNYGYMVLYGACVLLFVIVGLLVRREADSRTMSVVAFCVLGFIAGIYVVLKRPAGSTFFESAMLVFTLAGALLTMSAKWQPTRYVVLAASIAWSIVASATFPLDTVYGQVARSRQDSRVKWDAFEQTRRLAGARPIEVVFPDNFYRHDGVFELLLKAASDFPTWNITAGQKTILERYAPGMTFRYTGGAKDPKAPYEGGRVLVWFDRDGVPPLTEQYPELAKVLSQPGVTRFQRPGYSHLPMHTAEIPGNE